MKRVYFYFLLVPQGTFVHLSGILEPHFRKHGSGVFRFPASSHQGRIICGWRL